MKKLSLLAFFFLGMAFCSHARDGRSKQFFQQDVKPFLRQDMFNSQSLFNHLDVAFTAGTTGLGFDLSMPAGDYLRVRTGATFMPKFEYRMRFALELINSEMGGTVISGSEAIRKVNALLMDFTGTQVSDHVDMMGSPTFHNFKFMLDVFPFKKKNWYATVGFYAGGQKVAKAYNTSEAMQTLFTVKMYNNMYWNNYNNEGFESDPATKAQFREYGIMAMNVGTFTEDFYATQDMYWDHNVYAEEEDPVTFERPLLHQKGDLRFAKGELAFRKGEPYLLLPDKDGGTVTCDALVNKVRPYLGIGYNGALSKDKRSQISVSIGAMMWGGMPHLLTHDGVDLARDLEGLEFQVRDYVNIARKIKAYPILELRFSQRIF